jgi:hypothetical protein
MTIANKPSKKPTSANSGVISDVKNAWAIFPEIPNFFSEGKLFSVEAELSID